MEKQGINRLVVRFFRTYGWISYTNIKSNLSYTSQNLLGLAFFTLFMLTLSQIWGYAYSRTDIFAKIGFTFPQIMWYLTISLGLMNISPNAGPEIDEDIRSGAFAIQLIKPLEYPFVQLSKSFGESIGNLLSILPISVMISFIIIGPVPINLTGIIMFILSLPFAIAINNLISILIGFCAFWTGSTSSLRTLYLGIRNLTAGTIFPLEIFPIFIKNILLILPFANMFYGPTKILLQPDLTQFVNLLLKQGITTILLIAFLVFLNTKGIKRINSHGG